MSRSPPTAIDLRRLVPSVHWSPRRSDRRAAQNVERRPYSTDTSDAAHSGFHGYRQTPEQKDHRLYPSGRRHYLEETKRGPQYEIGCDAPDIALGGAPDGIVMRQTSYDCGLNAYLQRKSLRPLPYRDGVRTPNIADIKVWPALLQPPCPRPRLNCLGSGRLSWGLGLLTHRARRQPQTHPKPKRVERNRSNVRWAATDFPYPPPHSLCSGEPAAAHGLLRPDAR